jgi:fluoride exporter
MTLWILLALGGAAGAVARYTLVTWIYARIGTAFPWGTLAVNLLGSFLLGVVLTSVGGGALAAPLGALLAIGFLGDFTTFSTYAYETVMLVQQRRYTRALAYQFGGVGLGVLAVVAGMLCGGLTRG